MKLLRQIFIVCMVFGSLAVFLSFFIFYQKKTAVIDVLPIKQPDFQTPEVPQKEQSPLVYNQENSKKEEKEILIPKQLSDPPAVIKAVYATSWSAASDKRLNDLIDLIKSTELNALVIDIKDFSGFVSYDIEVPAVIQYGSRQKRIADIDGLIERLHNERIYVIGRIVVFQDPVLAQGRPDLAIRDKRDGDIWLDYKNLAWIDPASKEAWDYNIAIAKDALKRGFDEINFDYIRFPSDGPLDNMVFPFYDGKKPKREVIADFFKYLRQELADYRISVDLFGLVTVRSDDLGIGQIIEDAYAYFDFVSPMVYPSHYSSGFLGYENPALYPYEVIKYSIEGALKRLKDYESEMINNIATTGAKNTTIPNPKLRPWLQDFDLGADYDAAMVRKELQAVYDAFKCSPSLPEDSADYEKMGEQEDAAVQVCDFAGGSGDKFGGWMLWNPQNIYTTDALQAD